MKAIQAASVEEVAAIHGVGEVVAESLVTWFADKTHYQTLTELLPHLTIENPSQRNQSNILEAKTFVLTGTLQSLTRDEAKGLIRQSGGRVTSSVSSKTDYVVVGAEPGSKAAEAERLGVKILTEKDFLALVAR